MLFEELVGMLRCFGGKVFWRSRKRVRGTPLQEVDHHWIDCAVVWIVSRSLWNRLSFPRRVPVLISSFPIWNTMFWLSFPRVLSSPRTNHLGEPELDSWWEQFLARFYLPRGRALDYRGSISMGTRVNNKKTGKIFGYAVRMWDSLSRVPVAADCELVEVEAPFWLYG
jgi:hypothetical protein